MSDEAQHAKEAKEYGEAQQQHATLTAHATGFVLDVLNLHAPKPGARFKNVWACHGCDEEGYEGPAWWPCTTYRLAANHIKTTTGIDVHLPEELHLPKEEP